MSTFQEGQSSPYIRASFALATDEEMERAINSLADAIREEREEGRVGGEGGGGETS